MLATDSVRAARDPHGFDWRPTDCVALGNEYDGLDDAFLASADERLRIPMPPGDHPKPRSHRPIDPGRPNAPLREGSPSLNVATAAAIIACCAHVGLARPG